MPASLAHANDPLDAMEPLRLAIGDAGDEFIGGVRRKRAKTEIQPAAEAALKSRELQNENKTATLEGS
jgi:hypothetical protein